MLFCDSYGKITFSLVKLNVIFFDQTKFYFATAVVFVFFLHKTEIYLNKKRIFRLDNLKTPSNIPIFFDQFEYRIENADTNIKLFLYYIEFCLHLFV